MIFHFSPVPHGISLTTLTWCSALILGRHIRLQEGGVGNTFFCSCLQFIRSADQGMQRIFCYFCPSDLSLACLRPYLLILVSPGKRRQKTQDNCVQAYVSTHLFWEWDFSPLNCFPPSISVWNRWLPIYDFALPHRLAISPVNISIALIGTCGTAKYFLGRDRNKDNGLSAVPPSDLKQERLPCLSPGHKTQEKFPASHCFSLPFTSDKRQPRSWNHFSFLLTFCQTSHTTHLKGTKSQQTTSWQCATLPAEEAN